MDYCRPAMGSNISSIFVRNLHGFATECTEMRQKYTKFREFIYAFKIGYKRKALIID